MTGGSLSVLACSTVLIDILSSYLLGGAAALTQRTPVRLRMTAEEKCIVKRRICNRGRGVVQNGSHCSFWAIQALYIECQLRHNPFPYSRPNRDCFALNNKVRQESSQTINNIIASQLTSRNAVKSRTPLNSLLEGSFQIQILPLARTSSSSLPSYCFRGVHLNAYPSLMQQS